MNKSDFKVIYNLTKNFNIDEFKNLINNLENNVIDDNLHEVIRNNDKSSVIDTINKISNFMFVENNLSSEDNESATSLFSVGDVNSVSATSLFSVGGGESETSLFSIGDVGSVSETSNYSDNEIKNIVDNLKNFITEEANEIDSISEDINNLLASTEEVNYQDNIEEPENIDSLIQVLLKDEEVTSDSPIKFKSKYSQYNSINEDIKNLLNMI